MGGEGESQFNNNCIASELSLYFDCEFQICSRKTVSYTNLLNCEAR